jgi:LysM repeat protein
MMSLPTLWRATILTLLLSLVTGCFQFSSSSLEEEKDPNFMEGKKRVNARDYDGAIDYFEKALQANPRSAAAHFELAVLYEQHSNDWAAAIYHYQRHLEFRPNSAMAEVVKQRITACKLELAKTVSIAVVNREVQRDLTRLAQTNNFLKERLVAAIEEINRRPQFVTNYITNTEVVTQYVAQASGPAIEPSRIQEAREPSRPDSRRTTRTEPSAPRQNSRNQTAESNQARSTSYTVRKGDTFASIARKLDVPLNKLMSANPRIPANKLQAGHVIVVPAKR